MKAKMIIQGETTDTNFMALQALILDCGFLVSLVPVKDAEKSVDAYARTKRHHKLGNKQNAKDVIFKWLKEEKGGRARKTEIQAKLVQLGLSANSMSPTVSRLKLDGFVDIDNNGYVVVKEG